MTTREKPTPALLLAVWMPVVAAYALVCLPDKKRVRRRRNSNGPKRGKK